MKNGQRAIVIGAGIAGSAVALALRQAGFEPEIFESRPGPISDDDGLFLNTASNGVAVLKFLGVEDEIVAAGAPCPRHVLRSGTGKQLGEITNGLRLPGVAPSVLIRRAVLQAVLGRKTAAEGIAVHYGKRLTGLDLGAGAAIARFDDGSTADGDIVVGCDGIHSATRSLIDPTAPPPNYTGMVCLGGHTRASGVTPTPDTLNLIFGRNAFFGYLVSEDGETYWFSNVSRREQPSHRELHSPSVADWQKYLLALHRGDTDPIEAIIASPQRHIVGYPIFDMPSVPVWHRGRAIIIGDAAHATAPHAGQGASMALEDAVVLARCLRDLPTAELAFDAYERLRRERVDKIVQFARRMGQNKKVSNPIGVAIRDTLMPHILRKFATEERRAWIYDYSFDWDVPAA